MSTAAPITLRAISSMATQRLLAALAGPPVLPPSLQLQVESVGGVDAERRVREGEVFDLVFLSEQALERLEAAGALQPARRVDLVRSGVAVAVRAGAPAPALNDADAVRAAVAAAPSVGISTGPSGVALRALFSAWGLDERLLQTLVEAPPGVPVGRLVAQGQVALGFQQLSELMHLEGLQVLGPLPPAIQIETVFSGAVGRGSTQAAAAALALQHLAGPAAHAIMLREGMVPASAHAPAALSSPP